MKIFIYGDSNTWGYFPTVDHYSGDDSKTKRHEMNVIWWNSLKDYELIVDGNIGRSSKNDHPYYENKNAIKTINKDLENVSEVDLAIIMLGTNDCKKVYGNTPSIITNNLSEIIDIIKAKLNSKILVICPPLIMPSEKTEVVYNDGTSMIRELEKEYQKLASEKGYYYISATSCEVGIDGEHLTEKGHKLLGELVKKKVEEIIKE